jgi:hypothetical protein
MICWRVMNIYIHEFMVAGAVACCSSTTTTMCFYAGFLYMVYYGWLLWLRLCVGVLFWETMLDVAVCVKSFVVMNVLKFVLVFVLFGLKR